MIPYIICFITKSHVLMDLYFSICRFNLWIIIPEREENELLLVGCEQRLFSTVNIIIICLDRIGLNIVIVKGDLIDIVADHYVANINGRSESSGHQR